jgi:integrative and conjugative element protein (TIGR02256 family)
MQFSFQGVAIRLTDDCLAVLGAQRQIGWLAKEIGGQLFARFTPNGIEVAVATVTNGKSRRTRYGFFPDRDAERADVQRLFKDGFHYIGDWHTHPEDVPTPSTTDEKELQDIFNKSRHELPFMLLVVVGREKFSLGLYVGAVSRNKVQKLAVI